MTDHEKIKNTFLDILYPRRCPVCHCIPEKRGQKICGGCKERLKPVAGPRCYKCSKPLRDPGQEYCQNCRSRSHLFEQGIGIFPYSTLLQESLYRLKYGKRQEYGTFYGELAAFYARKQIENWQIQRIVPIPLHRKRMEKRGYNQAELIADAVGKQTGLPVEKKLLQRRINTKPQKDLDPLQRRLNLKDAFIAKFDMQGENILLTDDIYTTGATIDEAAGALKRAGAGRIYFLVVAIGGDG